MAIQRSYSSTVILSTVLIELCGRIVFKSYVKLIRVYSSCIHSFDISKLCGRFVIECYMAIISMYGPTIQASIVVIKMCARITFKSSVAMRREYSSTIISTVPTKLCNRIAVKYYMAIVIAYGSTMIRRVWVCHKIIINMMDR